MRFLYLVPNFQNPTGLLLGREKRRRLLELAHATNPARRRGRPACGELYFTDVAADASDTRPIKADDRDGRVVYSEQLLEDARARLSRRLDRGPSS